MILTNSKNNCVNNNPILPSNKDLFKVNNVNHNKINPLPSDSQQNLKCLYTNTDQLQNKLLELESFCIDNKIDIISITETLPKDNNIDKENIKFVLNGYSCIQINNGRGVCLFYKDSLTVTQIPNDLFPCSLLCNIKTNNNNIFTLGLVYRSPNSTPEENDILITFLHSFLSKVNPRNDKVLILGDFNLPSINWEHETCPNDTSHISYKFLDCIHEYYLTQFVNQPTHYRGDQNPTLIDLILSNDSDFVHNFNHSAPFGLSHHSVITFSLNVFQSNISLPAIT